MKPWIRFQYAAWVSGPDGTSATLGACIAVDCRGCAVALDGDAVGDPTEQFLQVDGLVVVRSDIDGVTAERRSDPREARR